MNIGNDNTETIRSENWDTLKTLFPENWIEMGRDCGAFKRLRGFSSPEVLLRVLLIHLAQGHSLRTTAAIAQEAGLANISDVAILKRLRSSQEWFHKLALSLLIENKFDVSHTITGFNTRLVDATTVKEPGKTGTEWYIHYSMQLPNLVCDHFEVTPRKGVGVGESLDRFTVNQNDLFVADRGYCRRKGIIHVCGSGGHVVVRLTPSNLKLATRDFKCFDLITKLKGLEKPGEVGDWAARLANYEGAKFRVCAIRKTEEAICIAHNKLRQMASKKQIKLRPKTLEYAKYVIIVTSIGEELFSAKKILDLYRLRWQIELTFKRFKSITDFGHLPKHDDESSKAWLYGKLFVALLSEKLAWLASNFSPWGLIPRD